MSGRIIDADVDAIANIARLTGQVAELTAKLKRQQAHHMDSRQELQEELSKSDAQRDELQGMLTAAEEQRDANAARAEYFMVDRDNCEARRVELRDRVRVLEGPLRNIQKWAEACLSIGATNADLRRVIGRCDDAIHVSSTPPAGTPAPLDAECPPDGYEFARMDAERDRLRAELAAANEEIARLHASMKLQRDATKQALDARDATKAQLGRAVVALQEARPWVITLARESNQAHAADFIARIDAILADADSRAAGEAWAEMVDAAGDVIDGAEDEVTGITVSIRWAPLDRLRKALAAVDARRGGFEVSADADRWCPNCHGSGRWWSTVDQSYFHCRCGAMRGLAALVVMLRWWTS